MSTESAPQSATPYEFTDEQNRGISSLADSMRTVAGLLQLLGLVFAIFFAIQLIYTLQNRNNYVPAIGLGSAMMLCLAMGFWTSWAATEFRKIVETKGSDIWHLMNALRQLRNMYSLIRSIVYSSLVLAIVGIVLGLLGQLNRPE